MSCLCLSSCCSFSSHYGSLLFPFCYHVSCFTSLLRKLVLLLVCLKGLWLCGLWSVSGCSVCCCLCFVSSVVLLHELCFICCCAVWSQLSSCLGCLCSHRALVSARVLQLFKVAFGLFNHCFCWCCCVYASCCCNLESLPITNQQRANRKIAKRAFCFVLKHVKKANPWMDKLCFSNRALVKASSDAPKCLEILEFFVENTVCPFQVNYRHTFGSRSIALL